jgi:hypothetical protein
MESWRSLVCLTCDMVGVQQKAYRILVGKYSGQWVLGRL